MTVALSFTGCGSNNSNSSSESQAVTTSKEGADSSSEDKDNEDTKEQITDKNSDTAEFVSKYLAEQKSGKTPEGDDGEKVVYLTFDDGPSKTVTPQILDILKEKQVNATFFLIGKYIDAGQTEKDLVKRIHDEGNGIGIHSYDHEYQRYRQGNADSIMEDVNKTKTAIQNVIGKDFVVKADRMPGGHMSWKNLGETDKRFASEGYYSIDWNELTGDAENKKRNPDELVAYLKSQHQYKRAVVLMHDTYGKENTAKALPAVIDYFKSNGYVFKTIKN